MLGTGIWLCQVSWLYGLANVTLETDYMPLVSLAEKNLNDMTPRLQRLMLKLIRGTGSQYNGHQVSLYLANTLQV